MDVNVAIFPGGSPKSKTTPLLYAIKENKIEFVKVLLDRGADVNLSFFRETWNADSTYSNVTPFLYAVQKKCSLEMIEFLLSRNPNLDAVDSNRKTAFALAMENHLDPIAEAIMKRSISTCVDYFCENIGNVELPRWSALGFFRQIVNFETLDRIVQISLVSECYLVLDFLNKETFSSFSIQSPCYDQIPPTSNLNRGFTLLHFLVNFYDFPSAVEYLIESTEELMNEVDEFGVSAFHYACIKSTVDMVDIFLANEVDITKCTGSGVSPLHIAASNTNSDVVLKRLLEVGASATLKKKTDGESDKYFHCGLTGTYYKDNSPLVTAVRRNNSEVVEYLVVNRVDGDLKDMVMHCLRNFYGQTLLKLYSNYRTAIMLWNNADKKSLSQIDEEGVLYYLASRHLPSLEDAFELVRFCVEQLKCHPDGFNRQNLEDDSPLHVAMRIGNFNFMKALIVNGANVNLKMPLHVICDWILNETITLQQGMDLTLFLLENGATSRSFNNRFRNCTALHHALNCYLYDLASLIIEVDYTISVTLQLENVPFLHFALATMVNNPAPVEIPNMLPITLATKINLVKTCVKKGFYINEKCHHEQSFPSFRKSLCGHTILHIAFGFFEAPFCAALASLGANINASADRHESIIALTLSLGMGYIGNASISEFTEKLYVLKAFGLDLNKEIQHPFINNKLMPYKVAVFKGNIPVAEVLLQLGGRHFEYDDVELSIASRYTGRAEIIRNKIHQGILSGIINISEIFRSKWNAEPCFGKRILSFLSDLVNQGYNINTVDHHGNSLMHHFAASHWPASKEFFDEIVKFFKSAGGLIDTINQCGQSPLHRAISSLRYKDDNPNPVIDLDCSQNLSSVLISHGADFLCKTLRGWSTMHIAVYRNVCVMQLLELGRNLLLNCSCIYHKNLPEVCKECMVSEVDLTQLGFDFNLVQFLKISPLSVAVAKNDNAMIQLLLSAGSAVSLSEIHACLIFGDADCANLLLPYLPREVSLENDTINGIPSLQLFFYVVNHPPFVNHTILHTSRDKDVTSMTELVKKYTQRGYQMSAQVQDGLLSPILCSVIRWLLCHYNDEPGALVKTLVDLNAPINVEDVDGDSLLTCILGLPCSPNLCVDSANNELRTTRRDIIQLLLDNFADTDLAHFHSYTYHKDDEDIIRLLFKANTHIAFEWNNIGECRINNSNNQSFEALTCLANETRKTPLRLMNLCRLVLRRIPEFTDDIHNIGIPGVIQDFLTFKKDGVL